MNFNAILGMTKIPQIESTTRKIAQNANSLPDVLEFRAEPISTLSQPTTLRATKLFGPYQAESPLPYP